MNVIRAKNDSGEEEPAGEVIIYGTLSETAWWDDIVTPKSFRDDLKALGDVKKLHVRINSYGGHVSAGSAIYAMLKQHTAHVTVHIDGFALSAASVVAMAGDTVIMPGNAMMMIHNPSGGVYGNADECRKAAEILDKMRDAMVSVYHEKTGLSHGELVDMLDEETWMTADEALEWGFADIVEAPLLAVAQVKPGIIDVNGRKFDLSAFKNVPRDLLEKETEEEKLTIQTSGVQTAPAPAPTASPEPQPATQPQTAPVDNTAMLAEAIKTERERMRALDELLAPGTEELIAKAKYETGASPESVAMEILKAQKNAGAAALDARKADAASSGVNDLGAAKTSDGIGGGDATNAKAEALRAAIMKRREAK
jgi:ATP-dependent protease ClpP protease subunit